MENKKDKLWEEIDLIVDEEYDGHYVVPTKPDEIDTSDISEYIRKIKEERKNK